MPPSSFGKGQWSTKRKQRYLSGFDSIAFQVSCRGGGTSLLRSFLISANIVPRTKKQKTMIAATTMAKTATAATTFQHIKEERPIGTLSVNGAGDGIRTRTPKPRRCTRGDGPDVALWFNPQIIRYRGKASDDGFRSVTTRTDGIYSTTPAYRRAPKGTLSNEDIVSTKQNSICVEGSTHRASSPDY